MKTKKNKILIILFFCFLFIFPQKIDYRKTARAMDLFNDKVNENKLYFLLDKIEIIQLDIGILQREIENNIDNV